MFIYMPLFCNAAGPDVSGTTVPVEAAGAAAAAAGMAVVHSKRGRSSASSGSSTPSKRSRIPATSALHPVRSGGDDGDVSKYLNMLMGAINSKDLQAVERLGEL